MRALYKVSNLIEKGAQFILVSNYNGLNEVVNYGCLDQLDLKTVKDENDIGFWRIKPKKGVVKK